MAVRIRSSWCILIALLLWIDPAKAYSLLLGRVVRKDFTPLANNFANRQQKKTWSGVLSKRLRPSYSASLPTSPTNEEGKGVSQLIDDIGDMQEKTERAVKVRYSIHFS